MFVLKEYNNMQKGLASASQSHANSIEPVLNRQEQQELNSTLPATSTTAYVLHAYANR
jgi:hypothetical protein